MKSITIIWCPKCQKGARISGEQKEDSSLCEWKKGEICRIGDHQEAKMVLVALVDSFISEKPATEPIKTTYFYAKDENGKRWVVKRWRESIREPCRYEVFQGEINVVISDLCLQEKKLRQHLEVRGLTHAVILGKDKADLVVAHLASQIKFDRYDDISPADVCERQMEGNSEFNIFVVLNKRIIDSLLALCRRIFTKEEVEFLKKFVEGENVPGGSLVYLGKRRVGVEYR
jgi:hypothetical protein